jgi:hypothetical protein
LSEVSAGGELGLRTTLIGRDSERPAIEALLRDAAGRTSSSLVISGPPGIGKSSLPRWAIDQATGFRVLLVTGVESEMAFGYAGVHQLLLPLRDAAETPPDPQRLALQTVFGAVQYIVISSARRLRPTR